MSLKEDYDFSCAHIFAHGSLMRCNRLTLNVKHYSNSGGACSNRDKKGAEERKNVEILRRKWPGAFRMNPKRRNEVIMSWPSKGMADEGGDSAEPEARAPARKTTGVKRTIAKRRPAAAGGGSPAAKA